jgi:glycosyltransferase involved in cell wall biosynthesis
MAPGARQIESIRNLGLSVDVVDMKGIPKLKYLSLMPRVRKLARDVDLIHAHFGYCGWLARFATTLSRSKPPLVISFMGSDLLGSPMNPEGDLRWFSTLMVRANKRLAYKAAQVIVKSQQMADIVSPVPSTIIPNGVNMHTFCPMDREAARRKLNLPPGKKLVLFPGNPEDPRKGHKLASAAVEHAARQIGEEINLVPLWKVEPDQVAVYMNACNVMLMTSLLEGSPNVVKEAMACNVPIVGVPVGDVPQLLEGVAGCQLCDRNPGQVGSAIVTAFHAADIGGREAVFSRRLDLESVARRIVEVYEKALGQAIPLPLSSHRETMGAVSSCQSS